jgi:hypothetical protein
MSQSGVIVASLVGGFILWLALQGRLGAYWTLLAGGGSKGATAAPTGSGGGSGGGGGNSAAQTAGKVALSVAEQAALAAIGL